LAVPPRLLGQSGGPKADVICLFLHPLVRPRSIGESSYKLDIHVRLHGNKTRFELIEDEAPEHCLKSLGHQHQFGTKNISIMSSSTYPDRFISSPQPLQNAHKARLQGTPLPHSFLLMRLLPGTLGSSLEKTGLLCGEPRSALSTGRRSEAVSFEGISDVGGLLICWVD
jgi:hypothetical protein